jgi:hypothetical protein
MSINITCGKESFQISHSEWNIFRYHIFVCCLEHLDKLFIKYENMDEKEYDQVNLYYGLKRIFIIVGREWRATINSSNYYPYGMKLIDANFPENYIVIDALIKTNTIGAIKLQNKLDCEGYYSPGDCYDMLNTFDLIIKKDLYANNEVILYLRKIWFESVNKNLIAVIS